MENSQPGRQSGRKSSHQFQLMHNELSLTNYPTAHLSRQKLLGSHGHCSGHAGTAKRMPQC